MALSTWTWGFVTSLLMAHYMVTAQLTASGWNRSPVTDLDRERLGVKPDVQPIFPQQSGVQIDQDPVLGEVIRNIGSDESGERSVRQPEDAVETLQGFLVDKPSPTQDTFNTNFVEEQQDALDYAENFDENASYDYAETNNRPDYAQYEYSQDLISQEQQVDLNVHQSQEHQQHHHDHHQQPQHFHRPPSHQPQHHHQIRQQNYRPPPQQSYSPPRPYKYQPPPRRPRPRPQKQRTNEDDEPVEVILTAVQRSTPRPRSSSRSGTSPAFKLANKTSMNLDGPGYALTLLLVGQIVILGMAFFNGLGSSSNTTSSRSLEDFVTFDGVGGVEDAIYDGYQKVINFFR